MKDHVRAVYNEVDGAVGLIEDFESKEDAEEFVEAVRLDYDWVLTIKKDFIKNHKKQW